jgi:hypothetical protein
LAVGLWLEHFSGLLRALAWRPGKKDVEIAELVGGTQVRLFH